METFGSDAKIPKALTRRRDETPEGVLLLDFHSSTPWFSDESAGLDRQRCIDLPTSLCCPAARNREELGL